MSDAIKRGHLHKFDQALQEGEDEFVKRRIYLTLERGRDIALRNLLRKVFIAGGFEEPKAAGEIAGRRTRVPIAEFAAAISLGSKETLDNDEIECFLANMIYKVSRLHGDSSSSFIHPRPASKESRGTWIRHQVRLVDASPALGRPGPRVIPSVGKSLATRYESTTDGVLVSEPDERVHRPRSRICRTQQVGCISGHGGVIR